MNKKIALLIVVLLVVSLAVPFAMAKREKLPKECSDGIDNDDDGATDWPADTGCRNKNDNDESNCGDGVCEGKETCENCEADCGPCQTTTTSTTTTTLPDSCSDTDGGFAPETQGTVSGYYDGEPYEYTDFCLDETYILEYYCSGNYAYGTNFTCAGNWTTNCVDGTCV